MGHPDGSMSMAAPFMTPPSEDLHHLQALLLQSQELLRESEEIVTLLAEDACAGVIIQCRDALTDAMTAHKAGNRTDKVLLSLAGTAEPAGVPGVLKDVLEGVLRNTYTEKMRNIKRTRVTDRQRTLYLKNRAMLSMNLISMLMRLRSVHCLPQNSIRRALENKYLCCPTHLWNISRSLREVPGEAWVDATLSDPPLKTWRQPSKEPESTSVGLVCQDNLEWWRSVKFARHINGFKKESELIHTVTGEHFNIPASALDTLPDPNLGNDWPWLGQYNYSDAVVDLSEMELYLKPLWGKILALQSGNSMQLLMRPPPEADRKKWEEPTMTWHPPIILECGTSSYADNAKIVKSIRKHRKTKKTVIACDMQTFVRMWWLKKKHPGEFKDIVPFAGEFHGLAHLADGVVILNWTYVLEPILLHFDVKGFHLKLNMKETSQRIRWIILILCAGQQWLSDIFNPSDLADIPNLLDTVKNNIPVWNFIGFLYYHASMVWGTKEAIQTTDTRMLDFMWRFSLRVYAHTNKNIYKKGCIQNSKILFDSEPRVAHIVKHHRTCNDSGRPCAGVALDYKNEKATCNASCHCH
jgi:hypothetical protein